MIFLKNIYNWFFNNFFSKNIEISIVGIQGAGKSTLINSITTGKYDSDTIPTIGVNERKIKKGNVNLNIWDLGGQNRFRDNWEKYCSNSDCIIFVVDSVDEKNFEVAKEELKALMSYKTLEGIPLLLLGNKNDLQGALSENELIELFDLKSITNRKRGCFSISAKEMKNLDTAFNWISNLK